MLSSALARTRKTSSMKYLHLSSAGITDEACQELIFEIEVSLELNGNAIQNNAGCVDIASLLKNPKFDADQVER